MVQFRPQGREVIAKIVYYGPPLGGKTTNLRSLYNGYPDDTRGELIVVPAGGDRTIFFDFLALEAGNLRGMKLRVQLYTVPGQVHYNATRQVVLRGVDAVVFVADSQRELVRANREAWENLKDNLLLQGLSLQDTPHVLQYNKRDLPDVLSIEDVDSLLNQYNAPFYEAVASTGVGVEETLQGVVKLLVRSLRDRFKLGLETPAGESRASVVAPPAASAAARVYSFAPPPVAPSEVAPPPPPLVPAAEPAILSPPQPLDAFGLPPEVTRKVKVPPFGEEAELPPPYDEPFVWDGAAAGAGGDDVFAGPRAVGGGATPAEANAAPAFGGEGEGPSFGLIAPLSLAGETVPLVGDEPYELESAPAEETTAPLAEVPVWPEDGETALPAPPESPDLVPAPPAPSGEGDTETIEPAIAWPEPAPLPDLEPVLDAGGEPVAARDEVFAAPAEDHLPVGARSGWSEPGPTAAPEAAGFAAVEGEALPVPSPIAAAARPEASAGLPVETDAGVAAWAWSAASGEPPAEPAADAHPAAEPPAEPVASAESTSEPAAGGESPGERGAGEEAPVEPAAHADAPAEAEATDTWPPAVVAVAGEEAAEAPAVVHIDSSAIQRAVPRAIAQLGEVRELEVEVPVPSGWTGGRRMTLQLRLTLVPQEEEHGE